MQSKFWAAGDTSSGSDESSVESQDEPLEVKRQVVAGRWTAAAVDSSSSEDEKRVVKSLKDRRWDDMKEAIRQMHNHMKISDYAELYKDYETLLKCSSKAIRISESIGVSNFFIRALTELENFIEEKHKDKESFKKLTKSKATAFNTLRAKVRKSNEEWRELIDECKADETKFASEASDDDESSKSESEAEDSSSEDDDARGISKGDEKFETDSNADKSDESEWSDSEISSDYSDNDQDKHKMAVAKWGLKSDDKAKKRRDLARIKVKKSKTVRKSKDNKLESKMSAKEMEELFDTTDLNSDVIRKRVQMIVEKRGRRGVDRIEQTKILKKFADLALEINPQCHLEVLSHLISAEFDIAAGVFTSLSSEVWMETHKYLESILSTMEINPDAYLISVAQDDEIDDKERQKQNLMEKSVAILTSFIERLDDEFVKCLQFTDIHSDEYRERLAHIITILSLLWRGWIFLKERNYLSHAASLAVKILEHMHYKSDILAARVWDLVRKRLPDEIASTVPSEGLCSPSQIIHILVQHIFEYGKQRERIRALLHLAYHKSVHDKFYEAKDLLQMTNIHELAMRTDVSTQILYNRNLAQLGLCAFRHGYIKDAHACLTEICTNNKHRELLAQGLSLMKDKKPEQEREEKRRLLPYHVHISLELVEAVHNICAMLLEVPHIAANPFENRTRPISRHFRKMLETYDNQVFLGPPENAREIIMAATKALQKGNWADCSQLVFSLNIWDKINNANQVKDILLVKIKQEAMKTYIFTYMSLYDSLSINQLSSLFDLPKSDVHSIVSRLMINEEIHASWDESSECILINRVEYSRLQQLALHLASKLVAAIDQNELTVNMKNPKFVLQQERRLLQRDGEKYGWSGKGKDGRAFLSNIGNLRIKEGRTTYGYLRYPGQNRLSKNRGRNASGPQVYVSTGRKM